MKIVHCCLSNFYIDNYNYQENALPRQNKADGHDVVIIASTFTFVDNKRGGYTKKGEYVNEDGIRVIRIPYRRLFPTIIMSKIKAFPGVEKLLEKEKPDIIMFHNIGGWELLTVARYKKNHPEVKLYVDSHADANNSATTFLSEYLLHKGFYKTIISNCLPYIDKIFYLSYECGELLKSIYNIPAEIMEFYPLGGIIFSDEERKEKRDRIRNELKLSEDKVLFVHSGKMDKLKRTEDIIRAFSQVKSSNTRLITIGSMTDDVKKVVIPLIEADDRILFLGWKTADELLDYLCAGDVYVQPGGQSATMQNAICCGCVMILYPHKSHEPYLKGNGYYVKTIEDMRKVFQEIADEPSLVDMMRENSKKIAHELLDYKKLAARLYE